MPVSSDKEFQKFSPSPAAGNKYIYYTSQQLLCRIRYFVQTTKTYLAAALLCGCLRILLNIHQSFVPAFCVYFAYQREDTGFRQILNEHFFTNGAS